MQESASGDKSEQLWFTLRRALIQMVRIVYDTCKERNGDFISFRVTRILRIKHNQEVIWPYFVRKVLISSQLCKIVLQNVWIVSMSS